MKKRTWAATGGLNAAVPPLKGSWVPHDTRDEIVDYVHYWNARTDISARQIVAWAGLGSSKFYDWKKRYGKVNEHTTGSCPATGGWKSGNNRAVIDFHHQYPREGYRRLTFMMLDEDLVAVSPSSVYRVLRRAGLMDRWNGKASTKGSGFVQPLQPHDHWPIDISYLNLAGTFYDQCRILDGCRRSMFFF